MTHTPPLPPGCGYKAFSDLFNDGGHIGCYESHLYIVDIQATPMKIPCPRCNTAAMVAHIFAQTQPTAENSRSWESSAHTWEGMIATALAENPRDAFVALEALGPQQFCTNNGARHTEQVPEEAPIFRAWPWPLPGLSLHAHLRLMAIGRKPAAPHPAPI